MWSKQNLLLLLIIVYYLQGTVYEIPAVSQTIVFVIIYIFTAAAINLNKKRIHNPTIRSFNFFICYIIISFILTSIFKGSLLWKDIQTLKFYFLAMMPLYYFYEAGYNNKLSSKYLLILLVSYSIISVFQFSVFKTTMLQAASREYDVVNNISYNFVSLMPLALILFDKSKITKYIYIVIIFMIMESIKRGALLCLGGGLFVFMIYYNKLQKLNKKSILKALGVVVVLFAAAGYLLLTNEAFMNRFVDVEENTSGRDIIYEVMTNYFMNKNTLIAFTIGNGFNSTLNILGFPAHNDILETLFCYGFIGLGLYLNLMWSMIVSFKRNNYLEYKYAILSVFTVWALKTMTTGVMTGESTLLLTATLGYSLGVFDGNKYKIKSPSNLLYK